MEIPKSIPLTETPPGSGTFIYDTTAFFPLSPSEGFGPSPMNSGNPGGKNFLFTTEIHLRFGYVASEAQIARYVDTIDFDHDEVFGIFNRRLELISMAHLAHRPADASRGREAAAEFGVSVLPQARRRGFGRRLFEHAVLHARNRAVVSIFIHALSENTAMLKIARDAGAIVERDGPDSEAWLKLPPDSFASHLDEFLGDSAAEIDYRLKHHARQVENLFRRSEKTPIGDG
jgi:GNAT superfamily N-acetyltransferase